MKWLARLIPLLVLIAVIRKGCRIASKHRREERELDGATL